MTKCEKQVRNGDLPTKLIFTAEEELVRKLIEGLDLKGFGCVVMDEAHERTKNTDQLVALLRATYIRRPNNLKV